MLKFTPYILILCLFISCKNEYNKEQVTKIIEEVKQEFAPDRRVAIFDITANNNGKGLTLRGESNLPEANKRLIAALEKEGLQIDNAIRVLPDSTLQGNNFGVVRLSVCNIRSKPKHSAELSTQATLGTPLRIYKKEKDWYYVQSPDGYLGWLDKHGLTLMNENEFENWQDAEKIIILTDIWNVKESPAADAPVVSDVLPKNILAYSGEVENFIKVGFPDGRVGFVPKDSQMKLKDWLATVEANTTSIFQVAKKMMGAPYLWGGTSAKGMDCSGYTKTVFFENGILLPRDASQQVHVGELIATDTTLRNILPGDLLFFGKKAENGEKEKVRHVSIYLGHGKMIHAAGNVKIESLRRGDEDFAEDRLLTFLKAKRILGSEGKNGVIRLRDVKLYR